MTGVVVVPEKKSPFFDIFFQKLPYPVASGIVRGIKVGLSIILAAIAAGLADGTLISTFHFIPTAYSPLVTMMLSSVFIGVEKWLRERGVIDDVKDMPTTLAVTGPPQDATVVSVNSTDDVVPTDNPVINEPLDKPL